MNLAQFQAEFYRYLEGGELTFGLKQAVSAKNDAEIVERLSIYRNNVYASLSESLADTFRTVKQLVGDSFFSTMAKRFLQEHLPEHANLDEFGKQFPQFIHHYEPAQRLPYLADVAQLEWLQHSAYYASDAKPLAPGDFAELENEVFINSTLKMHPSVSLLHSQYAVFSIWDFHEQKRQSTESVNYLQPECVLIARPEAEIKTYCIAESTLVFLQALLNNNSVLQAVEQTLSTTLSARKEQPLDPAGAVAFLIESQIAIEIVTRT